MRRLVALPFVIALGCAARSEGSAMAEPPPGSGSAGRVGPGASTPPPPPPPPPPRKVTEEAASEVMAIDLLVVPTDSRLKFSDKKDKRKSAKPAEDPTSASSVATPQSASAEDGQGHLRREQVQEVLAKHRDDFRPCVREDSVVRIDATITSSGAVADAKSERSTPDDAKLRDCVVGAFSRLTFPTDWARAGTQDGARLSLDLRLRKEDE